MKKVFCLLLLCAGACFGAEVNLIPAPFKGWYNPEKARVKVDSGILTITANPDPKVNGYQKAQTEIPLKGSALKGKKFELSFKYRTGKLYGAVQIAIRQAYGKGGSYHGKKLTRWDVSKEWKEVKHSFSTRCDTKTLGFYLVGYYMKEGEKVEIKDLKLTAL